MTFQEIIELLFPYLHSIRRLKTHVSFDLIFPQNWEFPNRIIEKLQVAQNEGSDGRTITSFVCQPNILGPTLVGIEDIIYFNLEKEEKEKLFKTKVGDLKKLFAATSLDQLKSLQFNLDEEFTDAELHGANDEEDSAS